MANVLRLPTELLQLIADYNVDLTILRLVCRHFNKAFVDAFAREYFTEVRCFFGDKCRVGRLHEILLHSYFARYVKRVTLTLDPLEARPRKDIPVALMPGTGDHVRDSQKFACVVLQECEWGLVREQEPTIEALTAVFDSLRCSQCPCVVLDCRLWMRERNVPKPGIHEKADELMDNIMQALYQSSCSLTELHLHRTAFLDEFVESPERRDWLRQRSKSLRILSHRVDVMDLKRVFGIRSGAATPKGGWVVPVVLNSANSLEGLSLSGTLQPWGVRLSTFAKYASTVLRDFHSSALRKVSVKNLVCYVACFWTALSRWKSTLQELRLERVILQVDDESRGQGWTRAFEILLTYPQLSKVSLDCLFERNSAIGHSSMFRLCEHKDRSMVDRFAVHGSDRIAGMLRLNVEWDVVQARVLEQRQREAG